jgi:disulfide bond formation protein DsbB
MLEINVRHHGLFLAAMPFALLAAGGLILGGVKALRLRRWSRPLLMAAMAVALVLEIACAKPQLEIQLEMADATSTMMQSMVKAMDDAPSRSHTAQSIVGATETMARVTAMMGIAMRIALSIAEVAFLIFGMIYLSRARTRDLFAADR